MRLILTHEQADFDALASLLAAYLLDETALPVLPHRMNRNVRAFLTIYGAELPFYELRDLPSTSVDSICLVDTQSLITVKGKISSASVHVVDHHPKRQDFPADWTAMISEVGATVTLLIEALRERDTHLSAIQATLLLLGIYEDTGSLTYSRTTARDLQAASFTLEQGANLRIAADFLNHPLSLAQQQLYDELRGHAQVKKILGHSIVIAAGSAVEMEEELSTIAHKLRDLLEPDALFMIVTTRSGIQMIARSATDHIDVSQAAAHFGGGGHDRAAAALIRDRSLEDVSRELIEWLNQTIQPAVTVAQLMSLSPQVLAPTATVHEAAQRMQRFGYEGYPVVRQGKVIGLLTRRAVDRALAHKLNSTAEKLMDAGEVTIYPDDSIEVLQRKMVDTGWGQIPVLNPETDVIIGIVTRTDILKTLTSSGETVNNLNLREKLKEVLPAERLALLTTVAAEAQNQRLVAYVVGGFVRDLILEKPSFDFDIVVEGDAISLARALVAKYGGRLKTHSQFGTAKWYLSPSLSIKDGSLGLAPSATSGTQSTFPEFLDLISARTEFYTHPSALPTVERGSIKLDLHRRDFTINTLALRLDGRHFGELHDYWGGLNDLQRGLVRILHSLSFVDDPTRILRAVRFEQRFAFRIEDRTLDLLQQALDLLERVSGERIHHELDHILDEVHASQILNRLEELQLLKAIHPYLSWNDQLSADLVVLRQNKPGIEWGILKKEDEENDWLLKRRELTYMLWLMRSSETQIRSICKHIRHPSSMVNNLIAAHSVWEMQPKINRAAPSQICELLEDKPLLSIYAVLLISKQPKIKQKLANFIMQWRHVTPVINGQDLRSRSIPPGPIYKKILHRLRSAWLDGEILTAAEEAELLDMLLAEDGYARSG